MLQSQHNKSSFRDSLKALEADIQHANSLAAALPRDYDVFYPLLRQLGNEFIELKVNKKGRRTEVLSRKRVEDRKRFSDEGLEREMMNVEYAWRTAQRMVLPNCGHALFNSCFHDWNVQSQSCPCGRGNLKRVSSKDLWVLTSGNDIIDMVTPAKENLRCLYFAWKTCLL